MVNRISRDLGRAGFSGTVAISSGGDFECRAGYWIADLATATPNTPETGFSIGSGTKATGGGCGTSGSLSR